MGPGKGLEAFRIQSDWAEPMAGRLWGLLRGQGRSGRENGAIEVWTFPGSFDEGTPSSRPVGIGRLDFALCQAGCRQRAA
jgi:hypothetical protein